MWGYEVPLDSDPVRWFKLLLLKDEDMEKETRSSDFVILGRNMLRETGRSAVELISEYLRLLWAHTIQSISKSRGEELVEVLRFHVVITVPAIWQGYARQGMQEAVKKAGILAHRPAGETKLTFVPEPEAAALATLSEPGRQISPGDVYVICDAGGGTVDLISYKVTDIDPERLLYKHMQFTMGDFRGFVHGLTGVTRQILCDELMFKKTPAIPWHALYDDPTQGTVGSTHPMARERIHMAQVAGAGRAGCAGAVYPPLPAHPIPTALGHAVFAAGVPIQGETGSVEMDRYKRRQCQDKNPKKLPCDIYYPDWDRHILSSLISIDSRSLSVEIDTGSPPVDPDRPVSYSQ
ncbi:hypothetical protein ETB97_011390 [Aspergillus alliaceus]|uniref:Uncharacterized protein n=1 Tax=Petromyces alliaceus TaxID=209559 RepID=A0A8H6ECR7_PETAA|nr:hypothetical protein ETB97_011390 [Aspergillus burnettii]